jgi:hypothetical protein
MRGLIIADVCFSYGLTTTWIMDAEFGFCAIGGQLDAERKLTCAGL